MILEVCTSGPLDTNAYLLGCAQTGRAVLFDAPFGSGDRLIEIASQHSLTIQMIVLTHSHWDHIGDVCILKEMLNVPVYIHQQDAGNLEKPGSDRIPLLVPVQGVKPDYLLTEGQMIPLGTLVIEVIETPGHTPGGVCLYLRKEGVLISGDTLFRGAIGNLSFPYASKKNMWRSLKKLSLLPKETRVYPGHGEATTIGSELQMIEKLMGEIKDE